MWLDSLILIAVAVAFVADLRGSADKLLVCQIASHFAPGVFRRFVGLAELMPQSGGTQLEQNGRKMACNEFIGTSLAVGEVVWRLARRLSRKHKSRHKDGS
jgi:hypothetical protein